MKKLKQLLAICECNVCLDVNDHRNYYQSVEQAFSEEPESGFRDEIADDVFSEMVRTDTMVSLQVYPKTPGSFFMIYHYDVEMAIDRALEFLNKQSL